MLKYFSFLDESEEEIRRRRVEEERVKERRKTSGGIFGILKRIFNFGWW